GAGVGGAAEAGPGVTGAAEACPGVAGAGDGAGANAGGLMVMPAMVESDGATGKVKPGVAPVPTVQAATTTASAGPTAINRSGAPRRTGRHPSVASRKRASRRIGIVVAASATRERCASSIGVSPGASLV